MSNITLSEEQEQIVKAPIGPVMVRAAAGTGKTRVLTERIIHLIKYHGLNPDEIMAVTFTNKAADEMRDRIVYGLGGHFKVPEIMGTIHSFFNRILKIHISKIDKRDSNYRIIDDDEREGLIHKCVQEAKGDPIKKRSHMHEIKETFLKYKKEEKVEIPENLQRYNLKLAYGFYEWELAHENMLDFDDIILFSLKLFRKHPEIAQEVRANFKTIFIDEIQDLSEHQWELMKHILEDGYTNFMAIGDPNQSIYLYSGALENIFEEVKTVFPTISEFALTTNYRSTQRIVEISNQVRTNDYGAVKSVSDEKGEVENLKYTLEEFINAIPPEDRAKFAILYYTNEEGYEAAKKLIKFKIPLKIDNHKLFSSPLVKCVIWMIRTAFFLNKGPVVKLLYTRLFGFMRRKSKDKLMFGEGSERDKLLVLRKWQEEKFLEQRIKSKVNEIADFIFNLSTKDPTNLKDIIAECSKFAIDNAVIYEQEKKRCEGDLEIFATWVEMMLSPESTREEVIQFLMNMEKESEEGGNLGSKSITLSTIHSAKGLEWNRVAVLKYHKLRDHFEEGGINKNLAYVAVTRAQDFLVLDQIEGDYVEEEYE